MRGKGYRFAILGTGLIAKFHARAIQEVPGGSLVAVCSRDRSRAEAFASEFGCKAYVELESMLTHAKVDVLVIATPSGAHLEAALAAAAAGVHVLCEKPLEISVERVDAMIEAHRKAGTQLGCIFQIRYTPALGPVREALQEGRFGKLTYAGAYVPWWRTQEYYSGSSWHGTMALDGGGALMNQAIHMVDLLCDLMPPVESVAGVVSSVGHVGIETEDAAAASLRFEGGAVGVVYGSTSSWPGQAKRLEISGTGGTAILVDDRLAVFSFLEPRASDRAVMEQFGGIGDAVHGVKDPAAMGHVLHAACFKDFVAALEGGAPFPVSGESARKSVALVRAIYEASATGRTVIL